MEEEIGGESVYSIGVSVTSQSTPSISVGSRHKGGTEHMFTPSISNWSRRILCVGES